MQRWWLLFYQTWTEAVSHGLKRPERKSHTTRLHHVQAKNVWMFIFTSLPSLHTSVTNAPCSGLTRISNTEFWVRFQVLTVASMMFRVVFWDILPCKMIVDRRFRGAYWWWRQYATLKRRSTIILHGSISQKTTLNNTEFWLKLERGMTTIFFKVTNRLCFEGKAAEY
jgi:hypothetical protein